MIKLPEPVATVTETMDVLFTSFGIGEDTPYGTDLFTESQLKQAVRDALEVAYTRIEEQLPDATRGDCADAIRALIKEI